MGKALIFLWFGLTKETLEPFRETASKHLFRQLLLTVGVSLDSRGHTLASGWSELGPQMLFGMQNFFNKKWDNTLKIKRF